MPATSKKQQMAAGATLSAKRGDKLKSSLKGASKNMADAMSETELEKIASTKRNGLPKTHRSSFGRAHEPWPSVARYVDRRNVSADGYSSPER